MTMKNATDDADFIRDNDSLYVMPLRIVPFETAELRVGRLIKNAALKPAIEIFNTEAGGTGQILIEDIDPEFGQQHFGWFKTAVSPDLAILGKLARLTSHDVYSLRVLFRELQIPVASVDYLRLSDRKTAELKKNMRMFTQPLMRCICGETIDDCEASDIMALFRGADPREALRRLQVFAKALDMPVDAIPTFLEDFADIYMSFSYYQENFDDIVPGIVLMLSEINELKKNWQMQRDHNFMTACKALNKDLTNLTVGLTGRFEAFHNSTRHAWDDISVERFKSIETLIKSHQKMIGGVLCGLGIKLRAWRHRFPTPSMDGPQTRAEFLYSTIMPGVKQLVALHEERLFRSRPSVGAGAAS